MEKNGTREGPEKLSWIQLFVLSGLIAVILFSVRELMRAIFFPERAIIRSDFGMFLLIVFMFVAGIGAFMAYALMAYRRAEPLNQARRR
jgi:hypothetical protein